MSQTVTIVGPNLPASLANKGTFHVHAAGCAHLERAPIRFYAEDAFDMDAKNREETVEAVYDPDDFQYDETDEDSSSAYDGDFYFAPCVTLKWAGRGKAAA